jgi:hypothetical protein
MTALDPLILQAHQTFFSAAAMRNLLHLAFFAFQPRLREILYCAFSAARYRLVIYVNLEASRTPSARANAAWPGSFSAVT